MAINSNHDVVLTIHYDYMIKQAAMYYIMYAIVIVCVCENLLSSEMSHIKLKRILYVCKFNGVLEYLLSFNNLYCVHNIDFSICT